MRPPAGTHLVVSLMMAFVLGSPAAAVRAFAQGAPHTVNVATVMVSGKSETILVDSNGMTLYYFTSDRPTASLCTGGCASTWPPLLTPAAPTAASSLPGKLAVVSTANGAQVSYNGHLLYRYIADTSPGQVNGNNRSGPAGGRWLVATVGLKAGGAETPGDSPDQKGGY